MNNNQKPLTHKQIREQFVIAITPLGTEDRLYTYKDQATQREFHIRRNGETRAEFQFFLEEMTPTGVIIKPGKNYPLYVTDERIAQIEAAVGPNGAFAEFERHGIDLDSVCMSGAGYSVNSKYLKSLIACSKEIEKSIANNERYSSYRELSREEKAELEFSSRVSSSQYWNEAQKKAEAFENKGVGVLKGCYNMFGALPKDICDKILSYLNDPNEDDWNEVRSTIITGTGTLWQAWTAYDASAPRSGSKGFPTPDTLRAAIIEAVKSNKEKINKKVKETGSVNLRAC